LANFCHNNGNNDKQTFAAGYSIAAAPETLQLLPKCFHRMKKGRRLDLPNTVYKPGSKIQSFENKINAA